MLLKIVWQFYKLSVSPPVNLWKKSAYSVYLKIDQNFQTICKLTDWNMNFTNCLQFSENLQSAWFDKLTLTYTRTYDSHNGQNIMKPIYSVNIFIILNKNAHFWTIRGRNMKQKPKESQIIEVDPNRFGNCLKKS